MKSLNFKSIISCIWAVRCANPSFPWWSDMTIWKRRWMTTGISSINNRVFESIEKTHDVSINHLSPNNYIIHESEVHCVMKDPEVLQDKQQIKKRQNCNDLWTSVYSLYPIPFERTVWCYQRQYCYHLEYRRQLLLWRTNNNEERSIITPSVNSPCWYDCDSFSKTGIREGERRMSLFR